MAKKVVKKAVKKVKVAPVVPKGKPAVQAIIEEMQTNVAANLSVEQRQAVIDLLKAALGI